VSHGVARGIIVRVKFYWMTNTIVLIHWWISSFMV